MSDGDVPLGLLWSFFGVLFLAGFLWFAVFM